MTAASPDTSISAGSLAANLTMQLSSTRRFFGIVTGILRLAPGGRPLAAASHTGVKLSVLDTTPVKELHTMPSMEGMALS